MDDDDQFLNQVLAGISEADIITIFFPMLRRALLVDTRHSEGTGHLVAVLPQVSSMEERIASIEKLRPQLGKVRSILGIPWLKSINTLRDQGITEQLTRRLIDAGMSPRQAGQAMEKSLRILLSVEHRAFISMVRGDGYQTLWQSKS